MRSAARRGINFAEADLLGRWWWVKVAWVLDEEDRGAARELAKAEHAQYVGAFDNSPGSKAMKKNWESATASIIRLHNAYYPWNKQREPSMRDDAKLMLDEWKRRFGDPRDPKVRARINATAKQWRAVAAASAKSNGLVL